VRLAAEDLVDPAAPAAAKKARKQKQKSRKEVRDRNLPRQVPEQLELMVSGTLVKIERVRKAKDGTEQTVVRYAVKTDAGLVQLPLPRRPKRKTHDETPNALDYARHVGHPVNVTGKGVIRKTKKGERTQLREVTRIDPAVIVPDPPPAE
jgi:hypothetical protein